MFIPLRDGPVAYVLGLWFVLQILTVGMGGGVAWFARPN